ncbi:cell wall hydrolase [Bacillota bacterium LX-D]|nr:cell wall hydrolase [Bacillota bacterium LX-D]
MNNIFSKRILLAVVLALTVVSLRQLALVQPQDIPQLLGAKFEVSSIPDPEPLEEEALPTQGEWSLVRRADEVNLLTRLVAGEATGEPYEGQVAVAAVMLNRVRNASFPNTISGVIYQPHAFESVTNGLIWRTANLATARKAAIDALNGWDPTYGALYFWNPYKQVSSWIWTRKIIRQIGNHVFGI